MRISVGIHDGILVLVIDKAGTSPGLRNIIFNGRDLRPLKNAFIFCINMSVNISTTILVPANRNTSPCFLHGVEICAPLAPFGQNCPKVNGPLLIGHFWRLNYFRSKMSNRSTVGINYSIKLKFRPQVGERRIHPRKHLLPPGHESQKRSGGKIPGVYCR